MAAEPVLVPLAGRLLLLSLSPGKRPTISSSTACTFPSVAALRSLPLSFRLTGRAETYLEVAKRRSRM